MRLFLYLVKANRTPVTQELYLNAKTMPHVYVIVKRIFGSYTRSYILMKKTMRHVYVIVRRIFGSYTRSYILMRKQCVILMLLLDPSSAVTQGVISS